MSVSRKIAALVVATSAVMALAVSFTGLASGSSGPSLARAVISVHADPGHVNTRTVGAGCGGFITVDAIGKGGGSGKAACGHAVLSVPASPGGTFASTIANVAAGTFVCQANALFAATGVDVVCTENAE